jgi:hypothetical protein
MRKSALRLLVVSVLTVGAGFAFLGNPLPVALSLNEFQAIADPGSPAPMPPMPPSAVV